MNPNGNTNNNNNNRLHLNFGFNDRSYNFANNRAYPTTPSAFPQPLYQSPGPQDYIDAQNGAYSQGYFMNGNLYAAAPQQAQYSPQYGQTLQSPQPAYHMGYNVNNDGTNGLIQQFSNQDLNSNRAAYTRAASPNTRPRATGNAAAAQPYAANPTVPAQQRVART